MINLFSHVGIIVDDLDRAVDLWTGVFGLQIKERMDVAAEGVRSIMISTGGEYGEATCIELIEPTDKNDMSQPIARRLAENGEGVFHLAVRVGSAAAAEERLRAAGLTAIRVPPAGSEVHDRVIVHPQSANGVLIECLADEPDQD
jgi:methylmalonyl-CoA/ethylmalonyl-CoA epimerase